MFWPRVLYNVIQTDLLLHQEKSKIITVFKINLLAHAVRHLTESVWQVDAY